MRPQATLSVLLVAAFQVGAGVLCLAQDFKPRLAIKTFDNPPDFPNGAIGDAITEVLTTELSKASKYRIVERLAVEELLKEMEFGASGNVKAGTSAKKGGLLGAEYLLTGRVTNFAYKEQLAAESSANRRAAGAALLYAQTADVRVDFRIVSVRSGETVLSQSGAGRKTNVSAYSELAVWNRFSQVGAVVNSEWTNSLIGRAAEDAIAKVVRQLIDLSAEVRGHAAADAASDAVDRLAAASGSVIAGLPDGTFVVSLGREAGLSKGDWLTISREAVTRNSKGQVVYREQQLVGRLEVIDVSMADRAKAKSADGQTAAVREGDLVTLDLTRARTLRGGPRGATSSALVSAHSPAPEHKSGSDALVKRGDRYYEDGYFAQALEQYNRAAEASPGNGVIASKVVRTKLLLKDFMEAEDEAQALLAGGHALSLPVIHGHYIGYCDAEITLVAGGLSMRPAKGDHAFEADQSTLVGIEQGRFGSTTVPALVIRVRGQDGKTKKYELVFRSFLRPSSDGRRLHAEDPEDLARLTRLVIRLADAGRQP